MEYRRYVIFFLCLVIIFCSAGGIFLLFQREDAVTSAVTMRDRLPEKTPPSKTPSTEAEPADEPSASDASATIVFSADFANNSGCETHNQGGCDIYTANIQFDGNIANVERLTTSTFEEVFPVFSADGTMIYANTSAEKFAIEWIDRASASTGILQASARGAVPLPDGKRMIFGSLGKANALMIADFDSETSLKNIQQISPNDANYGEPHGSVNGDIVFTKLFGAGRGSNTAQAGLYRLQTETFVDLTEQDGTAHCFWGSDGLSAYCNNAEKFHGIFRIPLANGIPGSGEVAIAFPKQAEAALQDMDYSECRTVSYAYGTFCDDDHAIVTMQCENTDESGASTLSVSKLVLLDISGSPPTVTLLGKNLAEAFAGVGESSYTASCMMN